MDDSFWIVLEGSKEGTWYVHKFCVRKGLWIGGAGSLLTCMGSRVEQIALEPSPIQNDFAKEMDQTHSS